MVGLELWLKYYSKYFDKIFVWGRGTKPAYTDKLNEFKEKYHMDYEIGSILSDPETVVRELREMQTKFFEDNQWVCFANVDEFLVTDTDRFKDLTDLMDNYDGDWIACEAYDVMNLDTEPRLDYSAPILSQRKYWIRNVNYNKVLLSKVFMSWNPGLHQIDSIDHIKSKDIEGTGLYLVHLKYADIGDKNDRDFGPVLSSVKEYGYVKEGLDKLLIIPEKVKSFL